MSNEYSPAWSPGEPLEDGDEIISDEEAEFYGVDKEGWFLPEDSRKPEQA